MTSSRLRRAAIAAAALTVSIATHAAVPLTAQVWTGTAIGSGSVSAVFAPAGDDPVYTVYLRQSAASPIDYRVHLQSSPDGTHWSTITDKSLLVPSNAPAGLVYQMSVSVKAAKVRLIAWPSTNGYGATVDAWIAN